MQVKYIVFPLKLQLNIGLKHMYNPIRTIFMYTKILFSCKLLKSL